MKDLNSITEAIIGAAIEVHKGLGPGMLESAYEQCLCYELSLRGLSFQRQIPMPIIYKGLRLDCAYRADLLVEDEAIVELKAVEAFHPVDTAQLLSYLRGAEKQLGLLINFHVTVLKNGIKRVSNKYQLPDSSLRFTQRSQRLCGEEEPRSTAELEATL